MALPPGRPPKDHHRRRHAQLPVTVPSHNSTSGYDLPACPLTELVARIAASDRQHELYVAKIQEDTAKVITYRAIVADRELRAIHQANELFMEEQAALTLRIQEIGEKSDKTQENFTLELISLNLAISSQTQSSDSASTSTEDLEILPVNSIKTLNSLPAAIKSSAAPKSLSERPEHASRKRSECPEISALGTSSHISVGDDSRIKPPKGDPAPSF